jgi:hypothetical protein
MKINTVSKKKFLEHVYNKNNFFLEKINKPKILIVKNFKDKELCLRLRNESFNWGQLTIPAWFNFDNNFSDNHRLHDNYPYAYVKQNFHGF